MITFSCPVGRALGHSRFLPALGMDVHATSAANRQFPGMSSSVLLVLLVGLCLAVLDFIPGIAAVGIPDVYGCGVPAAECPNENITFWLYTRANPDPQQLNVAQPETLSGAAYATGSFKIIIHGYTGNKDYSPNPEIRPAYLEKDDYNVISVDWGPLAREPCYAHASYTVAIVGNCTAQLLDKMIDEGYTSLANIHVVGFSLGAQVSSQIGLFLRSGPLPRLTGLDPALPLFASPRKTSKLDSTDAHFVDVIHTNAGNKGKYEPSGDVDFYVNEGFNQPGCSNHQDGEPSCSHARAPAYFGESINSKVGFYGHNCCGWFMKVIGWCTEDNSEAVLMGEYTPRTVRGTYYVRTRDSEPFALGKDANACVA